MIKKLISRLTMIKSGKVIYVDDKCLMGIPDTWEEIYNITLKKMEKYYEYTGN